MFRKYAMIVAIGMTTISVQAQNIVNIFDPKVPFTWLGLDFTEAKIIGEGQRIANEEKLREMMTSWNDLLAKEYKKFDMGRTFHKTENVALDFTAVNNHNNALDLTGKLSDNAGSSLSKESIQTIVDGYNFESLQGLGLMVNVESFDMKAKRATLWFTIINFKNHAVVFSQSVQSTPGGAGLRNNWANSVFVAMERIEAKEFKIWKDRQDAMVDLDRERTTTVATPVKVQATSTNVAKVNSTRESVKTEKQSSVVTANGPKTVKPSGQYYALLIGVSKYNDPKLNLENPVKDARKMKETLDAFYDFAPGNIVVLENPTRGEIFSAIYKLRDKVTPNDNLLLFYAGHGYWDEKIKQGYWWPKDATTSDPSNWLSNSDLREQLRGINSAHTLLVSDACFSGGIFRTRDAGAIKNASMDYQLLYKMPSRRAITSGTLTAVPDQSVFVTYLIKRLQQNDQPFLPAQQLFSSLRLAVINNSAIVPQEGVIAEAGDEGGDFIFIKKSTPKK